MYLEDIISKLHRTYSRGDLWTVGECGILADAIKMVFPQAEYFAIVGIQNGERVTGHVLVKIGNFYYDANGKHRQEDILKYWYIRMNPMVTDLVLTKLTEWPADVDRDKNVSKYVATLINRWYPIVES